MREGDKESEIRLIPEGWDYLSLDRVFRIERGGSPRPISEYLTESSDGYNWIKIGDTQNIEKYIYTTKERIKKEGLKKSRLVKEDDFILSNSMSFGKPYIMKTDGCIHDGWLLLRRVDDNLSIDYSYYLLSSSLINNQFKNKAAGSTVQNLNIKLVASVKALFPPLPEQQKIAEILSTLDDKIDVIDEQISETQVLKKGLMQRLLSRGIGHSQFKDSPLGEIPECWEVGSFRKYTKVNQGLQIPISQRLKEQVEGSYRYITIQFIKKPDDVSNIYYVDSPQTSVVCTKDEILMTRTGNTGIVVTNVEGVFHNNFFKIDFNRDEFSKDFIVFYLNSYAIQKLIALYAGGTTIPDLNHGEFYKIPLLKPHLKEQKRIASILSTVDEKLDVLSEKKEHYQDLKKGLMQQLLTGKIRVNGLIDKTPS